MFDMRCEEEAAVLPHSRARQEQLQLINNQLREEDDKWQDVSSGEGRAQGSGEAAHS
jgi:FtsZ-binding cell division protein ZapB